MKAWLSPFTEPTRHTKNFKAYRSYLPPFIKYFATILNAGFALVDRQFSVTKAHQRKTRKRYSQLYETVLSLNNRHKMTRQEKFGEAVLAISSAKSKEIHPYAQANAVALHSLLPNTLKTTDHGI